MIKIFAATLSLILATSVFSEAQSVGSFAVTADMIARDRQALVDSGFVSPAAALRSRTYLQEIITSFTADAGNPNAERKLEDHSYLVTVAEMSKSIGDGYDIAIVRYLDGRTRLEYVITRSGHATLVSGISYIFDSRLSVAEQALVLSEVKKIDPIFVGSFVVGRALITTQHLMPTTLNRIRNRLAKGIANVNPQFSEIELLAIRYQLPSYSKQVEINGPVADIRVLMSQYTALTKRGIIYKIPPTGFH